MIGLDDCEVMVLMGHRSVESMARPRKRNLPHTCWMKLLPFLSISGDVEDWVAYFFFDP